MPDLDIDLERVSPREESQQLPQPVPDEPGLVTVDATWGTIKPIRIAEGVETVGELEVILHVRSGGGLIDTRLREHVERGIIPTARWIDHHEIAERRHELDPDGPTILYCNGPQCGATPDAIWSLLDAGVAPERLRYYRGGVHDWVTLGLPLVDAA